MLATSLLVGCSSADGDANGFGAYDGGVDATSQDGPVADAMDEPAVASEAGEDQVVPDAPDADPNLPPDCNVDVFHQYVCCVFQGVNEFRQQHGVGLVDYVWHPQVAEMAQWYSQEMLNQGVFAHGIDGKKCGSRLDGYGVDWSSCGENLARNTYDDWKESCDTVIVQWAESTAGHREAMLESKWTYAGVGVVQGDGWWWTTMNFLEP